MEAEGPAFSDWQPHEKKVVLKVTLVRHGETVANRDRIVQGQTPGELTEYGREQARRLGKRLAKQRWDAFYCSDLTRTQQTAQELLSGAGGDVPSIMAEAGLITSPVEANEMSDVGPRASADEDKKDFPKMVNLKLVRERSAGELEGGPTGCVDAAAKASGVPSRCFRPKNGESWEDVQARADQFLRRLVDSHLQTAPRKSEMNQEGPVDGFANALKPKSDCIYGEGATDKAFPPEPESGNGLPAGDEPPRRMLRSGSFTGGTRTINHVPQSIPLGAYTAPQNQMRRSGSFSSRLRGIKRVPSSELQGLGAASGGRMLRSGSFTGEPRAASHILGIPRSESFGEGGGGRMLRSGSFTGEPRAAGHILGIPRSESFGDGGESAPPRVTGVKRAGSFNALAPKVMKRVDSLGLSKLFTDEMQVGGGADTARERGGSSGSGSDDDELEGAGLEAGGIIGRDRGTGGDLGGRESVSVWSDSDCNDGEMQIIELGPGGPSRDEEMEAAEKVEKTEERRPSGNGRAGNSWEAGEGKKENGRRTDSQGFAGAEEGPSPGEGLGIRGFAEGKGEPWRPSGRGTDGKERPKGRRKGGRPSVKRVLVVTHGGFIKEFVNASMAYAEGPNLSKTRSQTRQSLGWRTLLNPAGLPSQTAAQPLDGVNSPPGAFSLQGPLQIQRTFGHNNFVSFRAVDESGRSESFAGQAQKTFEIALEPSCDGAAETLTPKRLRFGQHDVAGPASPVSSPSSGSAPVEVGGNPPNGGDRAAGVAVANGARFGDERRKAAAVYPGRPRNTSVYEFEIKRLEGRRGTPQFTVKMIRENDVYHLDGLIATRTFKSPRIGQKIEEKVVWQSPLAKLLDE